ncbi:MAG TPA: FIST N-terminal domain-containing protein, partial [Polyangiaceae bacterium]
MRQAHTLDLDPDRAIAAIREQVDARAASVNLLFCSPKYDLERLGHAIESNFTTPVIACAALGQFGKAGFQNAGITAVSLSSDEL